MVGWGRLAALAGALAAAGGGCGSDSGTSPEVVVEDASLGGAVPHVLGASASTVFWSASSGSSTLVGGASLASLPAQGTQLAMAMGPVAPAGDHVVFVADQSITMVDGAGTTQRLLPAAPEALAGGDDAVAWSVGPTVSWYVDGVSTSATLTKIDSCDHLRVTGDQIYVAADGASGRRLLRIDRHTADVTPLTASATWSTMFPGGATAGATYRGRIADADADSALWLVEEMPSQRGIVVQVPLVGEASVVLQHLSGASGFFASAAHLYWQEGDELLEAPRAGGAASIVGTLPGSAGAFADGYIYFTDGSAIDRLRVE